MKAIAKCENTEIAAFNPVMSSRVILAKFGSQKFLILFYLKLLTSNIREGTQHKLKNNLHVVQRVRNKRKAQS